MIGWPVVALCFDACWFGELSQQPMWPHSAHRRRCSHHPSVAKHSTQPVPLGFAYKFIPSRSLSIKHLLTQNYSCSLTSLGCRRCHSSLHNWSPITNSSRGVFPKLVGGDHIY